MGWESRKVYKKGDSLMDCPLQTNKGCSRECGLYDRDYKQCSIVSIAESLKALKIKIAPGY